MNMQPADYLVHFSNVLLLVAYSVRDILWMRWFAVAAALTNIPYFLVQGTILWPPILWTLVFIAIRPEPPGFRGVGASGGRVMAGC